MRSNAWKMLLAAALAGCLHCGNLQLASGGVSETTNGCVRGMVLHTNGSPAPNTIVMLIPALYNPRTDPAIPDSVIDTTDNRGYYLVKSGSAGMYNIEGFNTGSGDRVLISGITIGKNDTTAVASRTLLKPGAVMIELPDYFNRTSGYFYLTGTIHSARIENGYALIDSVPAGCIAILYYADAADTGKNRVMKTNFTVRSGDTAIIADYASWKFSRRLYLNTTSAGARVSGNVYNFPVLVRLNAANFNFSQAAGRGADLRFSKSDTAIALSYEIETWDSSAAAATVWVKVDTVLGSTVSQYIVMHWGAPAGLAAPVSLSNGASVFAAANGFEAVWHLNTDGTDATSRNSQGIPYGTSDTAGNIGNCKKFSGNDFIEVPGLMDSLTTLTLSAWVDLESPDVMGAEIVSIGDIVLLRMDDSGLGGNFMGSRGSYKYNATWNVTSSGIFHAATGWHYLTYVIDGAGAVQSIYCDSILANESVSNRPINYLNYGTTTRIGTFGGPDALTNRYDYDFYGRIDEVRICRWGRSADWIKLCFMNQRADDKLIIFQ